MSIFIGLIASLIVATLLVLSLKILFQQKNSPGIVEQRLDTALEVELIVDAVERFANNERPR